MKQKKKVSPNKSLEFDQTIKSIKRKVSGHFKSRNVYQWKWIWWEKKTLSAKSCTNLNLTDGNEVKKRFSQKITKNNLALRNQVTSQK